jgi:hypothetical protein
MKINSRSFRKPNSHKVVHIESGATAANHAAGTELTVLNDGNNNVLNGFTNQTQWISVPSVIREGDNMVNISVPTEILKGAEILIGAKGGFQKDKGVALVEEGRIRFGSIQNVTVPDADQSAVLAVKLFCKNERMPPKRKIKQSMIGFPKREQRSLLRFCVPSTIPGSQANLHIELRRPPGQTVGVESQPRHSESQVLRCPRRRHLRRFRPAYVSVSMRQHTSAYVSIRAPLSSS